MESVIKTDFSLDLSTDGAGDYVITPTEPEVIVSGIFDEDKLPVLTVFSYTLSVQSVHFYVSGEPLKLVGLGLNETQLQCRVKHSDQWYEVEAQDSNSAICYLEYTGENSIEIRALGVKQSLTTLLKVVEKPIINGFTKPTVDSVNLMGTGLVPFD